MATTRAPGSRGLGAFDLHHRLARDPAQESRALSLFVEELAFHSVVKDERVARRILDHLRLPSQVPPLAHSAPEPQGALWPTGPPIDEHAQPPALDEYDQRGSTFDFAE